MPETIKEERIRTSLQSSCQVCGARFLTLALGAIVRILCEIVGEIRPIVLRNTISSSIRNFEECFKPKVVSVLDGGFTTNLTTGLEACSYAFLFYNFRHNG